MRSEKKFLRQPLAIAVAVIASAVVPDMVQAEESIRIEEIVVTAQKREESLQETPISLAAFQADDLEMKRIDGIEDLYAYVPNLNFTPHPNSANTALIYIRGVGIIDDQMTQDPSVGVYLDGVYLARAQGLSIDVADIERIEVLRGPQGTLYGRNSTGGAVNFITKAPSLEAFAFRQSLSVGSRDLIESKTSINLPVTDSLAMKIAFLRSVQDGFVTNKGTGASRFGDRDRTAYMIDALWRPTDDIDVRYVFDKSQIDDSPAYMSLTGGGYKIGKRPKRSSSAVRGLRDNDNETKGHALTVSWRLSDELSFKSITSYRRLDSVNYQDYLTGAVAPLPFFITDYSQDQKQVSQEFQIAGDLLDGAMRYILGAYYFKEEADGFDLITIPMTNQVVNRIVDIENKAYAIFGQIGYRPEMFDQRLEVTLGGRWSRDNRKAIMRQAYGALEGPLYPAPNVGDGDNEFNNFSPSLVVSYEFNDHINGYLKYVDGYKTGGFNIRASTIARFNEGYDNEELGSYEIGLKSRWLDDRVQVNFAAFYSDYKDIQVNVLSDPHNTSISDVLNAGKATIQGLELDALALLTRHLSVGFSYGYVDADFKEVKAANGEEMKSLFRFIHVPRHNYVINVNYEVKNMGIGDLRATLTYSWQDDELSDTPRNFGRRYGIPAYGLLNGRIAYGGIEALGGDLEFGLWGKNLTDKDYLLVHINPGLPAGFHGAPRSLGFDVTYRY